MADKGNLITLFSNAIESVLKEEIDKAETEEDVKKIIKRFESIDIQKLLQDMLKEAADDTFLYMKETMFEEVMTASLISPKSSKKVWWLGKCGHEWQATVNDRANGTGCPICRRAKNT